MYIYKNSKVHYLSHLLIIVHAFTLHKTFQLDVKQDYIFLSMKKEREKRRIINILNHLIMQSLTFL